MAVSQRVSLSCRRRIRVTPNVSAQSQSPLGRYVEDFLCATSCNKSCRPRGLQKIDNKSTQWSSSNCAAVINCWRSSVEGRTKSTTLATIDVPRRNVSKSTYEFELKFHREMPLFLKIYPNFLLILNDKTTVASVPKASLISNSSISIEFWFVTDRQTDGQTAAPAAGSWNIPVYRAIVAPRG